MANKQIDLWLISGLLIDMPIIEWLENLELNCEFCETNLSKSYNYFKGAVREMYCQLFKEQQEDVEEIKQTDKNLWNEPLFLTLDHFTKHYLHPEETIEFLTDLQHSVVLVGEIPLICWIRSAFVNMLSH